MKTTEQKERRREKRATLGCMTVNVYLKNVQNKADFVGRICDISPLGVRFVSDKSYPKDSIIYLGITLSSLGSMIYLAGKIVRCEKKKEKEHHIAVEILGDYLLQSFIREYISSKKAT